MLKNKSILIALFLVFLSIPSLSPAITMDESTDGDTVIVQMKAECASPFATCVGHFTMNFGDGTTNVSPTITIPASGTKAWGTSHTYEVGGRYKIKGEWVIATTPVVPPNSVIKAIYVMTVTPTELEDAAVAEKYEVRFNVKGGTPPISYRKISGKFPAGLTLYQSGSFRGIPNKLGRYRFTILFSDARGRKLTKQYDLTVESGDVSIRTVPSSYGVSRQGRVSRNITYVYEGTAVRDTLRSTRGEFRIAGSMAGYVNRGLTLNVVNGKARAIETVTVPLSVIRKAEQMRINKITYSRSFKSQSIVGKATSTLILNSSGGNFKITKMRLYFDNNRPRKVIARSSKDTSASVQINYSGTGLLKGYWEVDGRILQRVQKHVRFGKSLVLETPSVPPLPTYAEGTHRLRFIITSPNLSIKFPTAYYDVVEQEKSARTAVVLLSPADKLHIQLSGTTFSWQESKGVENYLISFFDQESREKKPVFTVYTKELEYQFPARVSEKSFHTGTNYTWFVLGLNKNGKIISESRKMQFSPLPLEQ